MEVILVWSLNQTESLNNHFTLESEADVVESPTFDVVRLSFFCQIKWNIVNEMCLVITHTDNL